MFDEIYSTDLAYQADCWKLCGDAHCCSFSRYRGKFTLIGKLRSPELPLLPAEFEFLEKQGWLAQFGCHEHRNFPFVLDHRCITGESIISHKPYCACEHYTRPTVCRMYPVLPVFSIDGKLIDIDSFGIYEELEQIERIQPACKITSIPPLELRKFLSIANAIGQDPRALFYVMAYRIAKKHVAMRLAQAKHAAKTNDSSFALFERILIRGTVFDHPELGKEFVVLSDSFEQYYGSDFQL